jgi:tetratricopeptide (TPR) repeat protein
MRTREYINTRHGLQLGRPLASLERLDEAEKIYLQALLGYKKALGQEAVKKYITVLNIIQNLAALSQQTGRVQEAEELYGQALFCVKAVFRRSSDRYRDIVKALDTLRSSSEQDINC